MEQQQLVDNLTSGQEALLLGNYAQAVNDLSRAVELNSNSVSAYYYRARALQYMGRSTDAAADYSRVAVMTRNGNYGSRYSDAQSLALQLGATSVGTSVFGNVLSGAAAGAQVTGPDGQQRRWSTTAPPLNRRCWTVPISSSLQTSRIMPVYRKWSTSARLP